ncbi:hypothetical protein PV05_07536 [Exophiala xenobiotica]|uniref:F-box domain-containing protein n=1 Tax=Exophiala xenobiotica TaxID=348802 RepID=A0A0D2BRX3_9EURO|nr:uncharacterized protein PV05_07536 [Exophiala xenobiotica]KIW55241.1 hypothetical protein PV05_07536 [Exophiala xenobiotica]
MALRRPERVYLDGESENASDVSTSSQGTQSTHPQTLPSIRPQGRPVHVVSFTRSSDGGYSRDERNPQASTPRHSLPTRHCSTSGPSDVYPFATDFGPRTLAEFLRQEIDKLKLLLASSRAKGKGKGAEQAGISASADTNCNSYPRGMYSTAEHEAAVNAPTTSDLPKAADLSLQAATDWAYEEEPYGTRNVGILHGGHDGLPSVGILPASGQSLLSTTRQMSTLLNTRRRRSVRLARMGPSPDAGEVGGTSSEPDARSQVDQNSVKENLSPSSMPSPSMPPAVQSKASGSSNQGLPTASLVTGTDSSRRTKFEEHTRAKRQLVRNTTTAALANTRAITRHIPTRLRPRWILDSPATSTSLPDAPESGSSSNPDGVDRLSQPALPSFGGIGGPRRRSSHFSPPKSIRSKNIEPQEQRLRNAETSSQGHLLANYEVSDLVEGFFSGMRSSRDASSAGALTTGAPLEDDTEAHPGLSRFVYQDIVPEQLPDDEKRDFFRAVQEVTGSADLRQLLMAYDLGISIREFARISSVDNAEFLAQTPRPSSLTSSSTADEDATGLKQETKKQWSSLIDLNDDHWMDIAAYLSSQDIKNVRLVNRSLSQVLDPILFRNVVIDFGKSFFDVDNTGWDSRSGRPPSNSMLKRHGGDINQFGIAFEYDLAGLTNAKEKIIEREQVAWFGKFTWPTENYPRYPTLQALEDLVDHNRPLLREAFKYVTKASELGLCIDSGHGWIEGPDISDLALYNRRTKKGSKVFGKTFINEDSWTTLARNQYFKWAQQNTINETIKRLKERASRILPDAVSSDIGYAADEIQFLENLKARDIESFRMQRTQLDTRPEAHIGGFAFDQSTEDEYYAGVGTMDRAPQSNDHEAQWPLIFGGYNLAAEAGGHNRPIFDKTANPACSPLLPGALTESQAQWLMETVWAQRAFLSAYTTAIITNKQNFTTINTLRISKLSSGLLPSLEQREFWKSLPRLKDLQILISPDWRKEHVIGDRAYAKNMLISPATAAKRFTRFLRLYVTKIESLHKLTIGYVGGGEHAVGMCARNQHVLPAPIVDDPMDWLHLPDRPISITKFDHVRDLKFENCWFTPWMLREFMNKSKDISLHSLTLESVSMTALHNASLDRQLYAHGPNQRCLFPPTSWLRETLPNSAAWCQVLDDITPGATLDDRKWDAGLVDDEFEPRPGRSFRGHIQEIVLKSCGYVRISLPKTDAAGYSQCSAVWHHKTAVDKGLLRRRSQFERPLRSTSDEEVGALAIQQGNRLAGKECDDDHPRRVMLSSCTPNGDQYPWLGKLTQCVHPIEKRVLEEAWNMTFGWGDDLERFGAVEDGFFEGGTGRFSGVIEKDSDFDEAEHE